MALRNIAIIAHVDHGKTTLVDELLKQSGSFRDNQKVAERAMDSNDLERERGITILAKCTSVEWKGTRINIVDTPGHADFGGEVERILNMVDGALVLVDAAEGPLPQTKFVVSKALKRGLRPIVAINKIDRPDERHTDVLNEVFDLFANLDATDEQLDFPILYGSGRNGWMARDPSGPQENLGPMFDLILEHVPPPAVDDGPFRMLATTLDADPFLGRILTGRVTAGTVKPNQALKALDRDGKVLENFRVQKVLAFHGLERVPVESAGAGDIIAVTAEQNREAHPIPASGPDLAFSAEGIRNEISATAPSSGRIRQRLSIILQIVLTVVLHKLNLPLGSFDARRYKADVAANSDFRKFDDGLMMTVDVDAGHRDRLVQRLEAAERDGVCEFGLHRQDKALLTCFVATALSRDHMHFIDGASGGYALAASQLPEKRAQARKAEALAQPTGQNI